MILRRSHGSPTSRRRGSAAARSRRATTSSRRAPTCSSRPRRLRAGKVHLARQVDGRLGIAAPAHAGPRLVRDRAGDARVASAASTSTRASSPATIRRTAPSRRSTARGRSSKAIAGRDGAPWSTILAESALQADRHNYFAIDPGARSARAILDPPAPQHLPGRRRRALSRLRRGRRRLAAGRARTRRAVDLASIRNGGLVLGASDMHFGATRQHDHAGPRDEHGRRLGNAPPARTGPRLGDRPAWCAGPADRRRDRHESFQGQLPGQRVARGLPRGGGHVAALERGPLVPDPAADEAARRIIGTCSRAELRSGAPCRTCGSTSFRTAASAACASMEPWRRLDAADAAGARDLLRACCGSTRWVERHDCAPSVRRSAGAARGRARRVVRAWRSGLARGLRAPSEDWWTGDPGTAVCVDETPVRARAEGGRRGRCRRPDGAR